MKKTKFNNKFPKDANRTELHKSLIQTYLGNEINILLAPNVNQIDKANVNDFYVENEYAESILDQYVHHTNNDNICVVQGLTGSGKTMLVRHVFSIHSWQPFTKGNSLIIPISFDNKIFEDVTIAFSAMMHAACDCLIQKYPTLKHIDNYPSEFLSFIEEFRPDLLWNSSISTDVERLRAIHTNHHLKFYCCALMFYLSQTNICLIDNVVIVVDGVEGIRLSGDSRAELLPVKATLNIISCLESFNIAHIAPLSVNTIICCRHYVYRMMRTIPFSPEEDDLNYIHAFETYSNIKYINLDTMPPIVDIIRKRYEWLIETEKVHSDEKWSIAMRVVMSLIENIDKQLADFIDDLTLGNRPEAMRCIKQLVLNKRWIQRDTVIGQSGAFLISDLTQFHVTQASLIRAIGMNESNVYNSQESIIPNLLYNEPDCEMDLFPLLTLKYFLNISNYREMHWNNFFSISHFLNLVDQLFQSSEYNEYFKKSINFLITHRLLLRSLNQDQTDNSEINRKSIKAIENVYVSDLAVNMWRRLSSTSVFLEMFVDDIWLRNDFRVNSIQNYPTQYREFATDNFLVSLDYISDLIAVEHKIVTNAKLCNTSIKYEDLFGSEPICYHLILGLENSLNSYFKPAYRPTNPEKYATVDQWMARIEDLKKKSIGIY